MNAKSSLTPAAGAPGASARDRGLARAAAPFLLAVFLCGAALGGVWRPGFLAGEAGVAALLVSALLLLGAGRRALRLLDRHEAGARGEEAVARRLDTLPAGWTVAHGAPLAGREADHVAAGPAGVFLIETVAWPGRVRVESGRLWHGERAYPGYALEDLEARAAELAEALGVETDAVRPAVCVAEGRLTRPAGFAGRVWIGEARDLVAFLTNPETGSPPVSDPPEIRRKLNELCEKENRP